MFYSDPDPGYIFLLGSLRVWFIRKTRFDRAIFSDSCLNQLFNIPVTLYEHFSLMASKLEIAPTLRVESKSNFTDISGISVFDNL